MSGWLPACLAVALVLLAGCSSKPGRKPLTAGCKNSTEQLVIGEIVARHLERQLGETVNRRFPVGNTGVAHQALISGEIDLYPEYTGVAYMNVLRLPLEGDSGIVRERVKDEYAKRFQSTWLPVPGFDSRSAMIVLAGDAKDRKIVTLSDATKAGSGWKIGSTSEFLDRSDGFSTLMRAYRLRLTAAPRNMDGKLLYKALDDGQVNMIAGRVTDGMLLSGNAIELQDDKQAFPPAEAGLVVRNDVLETRPGLRTALDQLSGKLTLETMRKLNYEVEGKGRKPADVAAEFLGQ